MIGTKGKRVQNEVVVRLSMKLKEIEIIILRLNRFVWFYFDIGRYHNYPQEKRIALDFWIEIRGQIYGISKEKVIECKDF